MNLKQKIQQTMLFDEEDKIAILAAVDTYSADDIEALEGIIDEFDVKHKKVIAEYKKSVYGVLDTIVSKASSQEKKKFLSASSTIRSGMDALLQ